MIKKIILIMSILYMINIFEYGETKTDKVYMRIIKTPSGGFGGTDYKYNDKNIPLITEQREMVYGQSAYDRLRYYLFNNNGYVGEEAEDFDTVLLLTDSWIDYGERPKKLIKKEDREFSGYMFKFDNEKLINIVDIVCNYTENPNEIDLIKVKKIKRGKDPSFTEIFLNEEYYPELVNIPLNYYINIYATLSFPEIKYLYEYYENKYTYDGNKQVKKIKEKAEDSKPSETILEYDNLGRIKKIYKKWPIENDDDIDELYIIYKDNFLFYIQRFYVLKIKSINLFYSKYNEYGYLELKGKVKIDIDVEKDFNNIDKIIKEIEKIEIKTGIYSRYKYEKANPDYKENLKIQPTLLDPEDLTEYFLGIHGWFRYKYLNDIKE